MKGFFIICGGLAEPRGGTRCKAWVIMRSLYKHIVVVFTWAVLVAVARANECTAPSSGPDAVVMDVPDEEYWATMVGISAFSFGADILNKGNAPLPWQVGIAQNAFRLKDNRFEQIGMSWVKVVGIATTDSTYCACVPPGSSTTLGKGCSDVYDASFNGIQSILGPRSTVDAYAGTLPALGGTAANAIERRLQVRVTDIDPALNPSALYFAEIQLVSPPDTNAGNSINNSSHEPRIILTFQGVHFFGGEGPTVTKLPAIYAWRNADSSVNLLTVDVPNEGRFYVASRISDNGDDTWHYEYAIFNLNSHRSARSFSVPIQSGITVSNIGFHDIDYHSGEPFDGTDWPGVHADGTMTWSTNTFDMNANANALRWGTLYNFRFDADGPPAPNSAALGLFRPGTPTEVTIAVPTPVVVVPLLSPWSLLMMCVALVGAGWAILRDRAKISG